MKYRCLCLREPWLYLMLDIPEPHRKNVENRVRCITRSMGPIFVKASASKRDDRDYYNGVQERVQSWEWFPMDLFPCFEDLQFGGLRGVLNFQQLLELGFGRDLRWKFDDCFGYVVNRAVNLPFRPFKGGGQGIFYIDPTIEEAQAFNGAGTEIALAAGGCQ